MTGDDIKTPTILGHQTLVATASASQISEDHDDVGIRTDVIPWDDSTPHATQDEFSLLLNQEPVTLELNRNRIVDDLMRAFMSPEVLSTTLKFSFTNEIGSDMTGVSRDVYTSFWNMFLDNNADGEDSRVPSVNAKWQTSEWCSVGRILVKGYLDHSILPLRLSCPFLVVIVHGIDAASSPTMLCDGLFGYLSSNDSRVLKAALADPEGATDEVFDAVTDIFESLNVKALPHRDQSLREQVRNIAHAKLLQEPKFIIDVMSTPSREILSLYFPDPASIVLTYEEKTPTCKKVAQLINALPQSPAENDSHKFLMQYIRSLSSEKITRLLHFMTGACVIAVDKVDIHFTNIVGAGRRPIAKTCGPVLELPSTYHAYRELRQEFDAILAGDSSFEMDFA